MNTRIVLLVLVAVVLCVASLLVGMRSALRMDDTFFLMRGVKQLFTPTAIPKPAATGQTDVGFNSFEQLTNFPGKTVVPAPVITDKTIVAFVFGQSNSANHGGQKFTGEPSVFNFFEGRFYRAADPLLGATGSYGGAFALTANKLIAHGLADQVVLIAAGIGSSPVREWRSSGALNGMLEARLKESKAAGLTVTDFFWHQGAADNPVANTTAGALDQYRKGLLEVIDLTRQYFPKSRFYVARASRCSLHLPSSQSLLDVQTSLATEPNVFGGPNTDLIGYEDRFDGCHFSASGLEKHSDGWVSAIRASRDVR